MEVITIVNRPRGNFSDHQAVLLVLFTAASYCTLLLLWKHKRQSTPHNDFVLRIKALPGLLRRALNV